MSIDVIFEFADQFNPIDNEIFVDFRIFWLRFLDRNRTVVVAGGPDGKNWGHIRILH